MRINDIIETFNKALSNDRAIHHIEGNGYFVTHTNWERKMGLIKSFTTNISFINKNSQKHTCIDVTYKISCEEADVSKYEEETQLKALEYFIGMLRNGKCVHSKDMLYDRFLYGDYEGMDK